MPLCYSSTVFPGLFERLLGHTPTQHQINHLLLRVAFVLSEVQIHSEYRKHLQPKIANAECYDFRLVLPPSYKTSTEPNCECRSRNPHEPKIYTIYASIPN